MPTVRDVIEHLERAAQEAKKRGELEAVVAFYEAVVMLRAAQDPGAARALAKALTGPNKARTLFSNMAQPQAEVQRRRRGRPTQSQHPFPKALGKKTVAEWARENGFEREVVKSWFAPPPSGRRIPLKVAKAIEAELGVPATEGVWRNGIR